jgi:hypothetical protein
MSELLAALAIVALAALGTWLLGSVVLRLAGVVLIVAGLIGTATGRTFGLVVAAVGALAWVAGQYLYGLRHHAFASPLAHRLFTHRPLRRIDPTRQWEIPTTSDGPRGFGGHIPG